MVRNALVPLCLAVLLVTGCASSLPSEGEVVASQPAQTAEPGSAYCLAVEKMFDAQPDGAFQDAEFALLMGSYAVSVEQVAALASPEESVALWELAATAHVVAGDPTNHESAKRFGVLAAQLAPVTLRAGAACQIGS